MVSGLFIRQLELVAELTTSERQALSALPLRSVAISAGADILQEGDYTHQSCFVIEGVVCRYKMVNGGDRQILSFHLAGDMPDIQSVMLEHMDHSIAAVTPARIAFVPHDAIRALSTQEPGLARAFAKYVLVDGAIFREWIANIGQRPAMTRIAHLLCEFYLRTRLLGLSVGEAMLMPLTQTDLADATGMSVVHVNRVMQQLRHDGFISTQGRSNYTVHDWEGLQRVGDFNPRYLHLRPASQGLGA